MKQLKESRTEETAQSEAVLELQTHLNDANEEVTELKQMLEEAGEAFTEKEAEISKLKAALDEEEACIKKQVSLTRNYERAATQLLQWVSPTVEYEIIHQLDINPTCKKNFTM